MGIRLLGLILLLACFYSKAALANPFAEYTTLSDSDIRARCQANIGTPTDTIQVGNRSDSACMTAYRNMRDLGRQYEAELSRQGTTVGAMPTCNAGTSQFTCFNQQAAMLSRGVGANTEMARILGAARLQVGEIQRANQAAIRQYNSDFQHMTGRPYLQEQGNGRNRSDISSRTGADGIVYNREAGYTSDGQVAFARDSQYQVQAAEALGGIADKRGPGATPSNGTVSESPPRPFSPQNGGVATPEAYQAKIPQLVREQQQAAQNGDKFNGTAASQQMQHQSQAQQMQKQQREVTQSRDKLDTKERELAAAEKGEKEKLEKGKSEKPGEKSEASVNTKKMAVGRGVVNGAELGAGDSLYEGEPTTKQDAKAEALASFVEADGEISRSPASNDKKELSAKELRELLRKSLSEKRRSGQKLTPEEEAILAGLPSDPMERAAVGDKKSDSEIAKEMRELFGMNSVETDAFVRETVEAFLKRTQSGLLGIESEALFLRVRKAHQRFATRTK